jgi:hypothetical protein
LALNLIISESSAYTKPIYKIGDYFIFLEDDKKNQKIFNINPIINYKFSSLIFSGGYLYHKIYYEKLFTESRNISALRRHELIQYALNELESSYYHFGINFNLFEQMDINIAYYKSDLINVLSGNLQYSF